LHGIPFSKDYALAMNILIYPEKFLGDRVCFGDGAEVYGPDDPRVLELHVSSPMDITIDVDSGCSLYELDLWWL
jgi:hypothetical protein